MPTEDAEQAQRHMQHYRSCPCLGDSATCCDTACCPPTAEDATR